MLGKISMDITQKTFWALATASPKLFQRHDPCSTSWAQPAWKNVLNPNFSLTCIVCLGIK